MSDSIAPHAALSELIARLRGAGIDWDAEKIADLMWLSRYMDREITQRSQTSSPQASPTPIRQQTNPSQPVPQPPPDPAPPPDPGIGLYSGVSQPQTKQSVPSEKGIPFQAPTAPALRKTLAIGRALRPLMRKVDSYTQQILDEDATAEQTAEQRFCMTVVRPAKERWLEVALVIEDSAASILWRETIRDFKQLLERQGAFRAVTVWHLQTSPGAIKLFTKSPTKTSQQPSRSPKELLDASGRRLILLVSDCISSAWRTGELHQACLELWAAHSPLAIVQLLPGHLWSRTVLSAGLEVQLGAWMPGVTNQQLLFQEPPIGAEQNASEGLKLPVITLEPNSLTPWAKMVSGWGESWAAGIWFDQGWQTLQPTLVSSAVSLTAEQLVKRFTTTASSLAKRLAGLMALVPVDLPIVYLLQETMLPESTPLHLAEIFMSGLVERTVEAISTESVSQSREPTYDFVPDVRQPLIASVPTPVKEAVLDRVSQYIGKKLNRSIYSFTALLQLEKELGETAGSDLLKFANIAKQVLRQMGGDYATLVESLDLPIKSGSPIQQPAFETPPLRTLDFMQAQLIDAEDNPNSEAEWPPIQMDGFTVATIAFGADSVSSLELFEFEIATLEKQQTGLFRQRTEWVTNKRRGQARRFVEVLSRLPRPDLQFQDAADQRQSLINRLKVLPAGQFDQVLVALGRPYGVATASSQERRTYSLLQWVEGPTGSGLAAVEEVLQRILGDMSEGGSEPSDTDLEMVFIPGGTFTMGSPTNEPDRLDQEGAQHEVTVQTFFMGRYPITQAQWRFVAALEQVNRKLNPEPSRFKGDNRPVELVSWYEAVEFCDRLSNHTQREYRLPTEAEWEYACRAGTETPFHFGATISSELANYRGTTTFADGPAGEHREETTPVDHFGVANDFGLSDMHGNVLEWCRDHYHNSYRGASKDGSAWSTDNENASRILRGGSWFYFPRNCRSAYRDDTYPEHHHDYIGFRVVCAGPMDSSS
ncbi:MAG: formylglycine-generating enzyme family protein [Cyanobacteria bacterium J06635_15]